MSKTNNIEIVSVTFGAGESRLFAMSGNYFEIIDAPSPVDVILSAYTGEQRARMSQAGASFYSKGVEFGVIQITSASAQTIRLAYGSGETGTRRATGSVTISGAVALDAATLAALEQINVRPEASTGNFASATNVAAGSNQIFAPGANPNGVLLQLAQEYAFAGSGIQLSLLSKTSAPTGPVDGEAVAVPAYPGGGFANLVLPSAVIIPAGHGLYLWATAASTSRQAAYRWKAF